MNNSTLVFWSAILLVGFNVMYHVSQKSVSAVANPLLSSICTFFIALVASIVVLPFFTDVRDIRLSIGNLNWASVLAGVCCAGIIPAHVLYYRSGWSLSSGTLFSYAAICVILIPIGLIFFQEKMTFQKLAGVIISLIGMYLLTAK